MFRWFGSFAPALLYVATAGLAAAPPPDEEATLFRVEPTDTKPRYVQYAISADGSLPMESRFVVRWVNANRIELSEKQECLYGIERVECALEERESLAALGCSSETFCRLKIKGFPREISICRAASDFVSGMPIEGKLSLLDRVIVERDEHYFELRGRDPATQAPRVEKYEPSWFELVKLLACNVTS